VMAFPTLGSLTIIWPHTAILLTCVVLASAAQLLLKLGADRRRVWWQSFLDGRTLLGYGLLVLVAVAMVFAMQRLELKLATGAQALVYVLVVLGARLFLNERLTPWRVMGLALIAAGVVVFNA